MQAAHASASSSRPTGAVLPGRPSETTLRHRTRHRERRSISATTLAGQGFGLHRLAHVIQCAPRGVVPVIDPFSGKRVRRGHGTRGFRAATPAARMFRFPERFHSHLPAPTRQTSSWSGRGGARSREHRRSTSARYVLGRAQRAGDVPRSVRRRTIVDRVRRRGGSEGRSAPNALGPDPTCAGSFPRSPIKACQGVGLPAGRSETTHAPKRLSRLARTTASSRSGVRTVPAPRSPSSSKRQRAPRPGFPPENLFDVAQLAPRATPPRGRESVPGARA